MPGDSGLSHCYSVWFWPRQVGTDPMQQRPGCRLRAGETRRTNDTQETASTGSFDSFGLSHCL